MEFLRTLFLQNTSGGCFSASLIPHGKSACKGTFTSAILHLVASTSFFFNFHARLKKLVCKSFRLFDSGTTEILNANYLIVKLSIRGYNTRVERWIFMKNKSVAYRNIYEKLSRTDTVQNLPHFNPNKKKLLKKQYKGKLENKCIEET